MKLKLLVLMLMLVSNLHSQSVGWTFNEITESFENKDKEWIIRFDNVSYLNSGYKTIFMSQKDFHNNMKVSYAFFNNRCESVMWMFIDRNSCVKMMDVLKQTENIKVLRTNRYILNRNDNIVNFDLYPNGDDDSSDPYIFIYFEGGILD